jgi:dipeptidase E
MEDGGRIVAIGGVNPDNQLLEQFLVELGRARRERPRVCWIPTASGDFEHFTRLFHRAFAGLDCEPTELALFNRTVRDLRAFVLDQDVIYVGGGNTLNLLAVWRAHGMDEILREAWEAGVVLSGFSAGMLCWFEAGITDSFGLETREPLHDGLGFLPGGACSHYDEPEHRSALQRALREGFPATYAADDAAALVFRGTELEEAVASRPSARACRVGLDGSGEVEETELPVRRLGSGVDA